MNIRRRGSGRAPHAAAAAHWAALLACALLAALAAPPLWANAGLLADIDGAIEFHETKTRSQAHIAFWKQVRAAVVAEAVPDALKQEFDQRAAGAKPGGRFYQLYMDVKAAFDRILNPPAPTATISVSPQAIELGQPATLSWSATNSDTTTLDGVEVEHGGSREVSPHVTTTYALQASNGGGTAYVTAELEVTPPRAQQS
ncbi:MAG: hypothetical protein F4X81_08460, partial [Gammaproteobacteria bacterium]|nr:hypothetical protein [Gammaproteobacteria bacterium]